MNRILSELWRTWFLAFLIVNPALCKAQEDLKKNSIGFFLGPGTTFFIGDDEYEVSRTLKPGFLLSVEYSHQLGKRFSLDGMLFFEQRNTKGSWVLPSYKYLEPVWPSGTTSNQSNHVTLGIGSKGVFCRSKPNLCKTRVFCQYQA